jgi:hypothetical protein
MRSSKTVITVLCIVLLVSIGLNIAQSLRYNNAFHQAEERYMVQINNDIQNAYDLLESFITGENRSEKTIHRFSMQLIGLHSLLLSNSNILGYSILPDLKIVGAFISGGGSTNHVLNINGIYSDGVVSDDEIAFLREVLKCLKILVDNAYLDFDSFNETLKTFYDEWNKLPYELLAD